MEINRISMDEFLEFGFLQEVNRQFFHPLGLALEMIIGDDGKKKLGGVWDYRQDPEGMIFDNIDPQKADRVLQLQGAKHEQRRARLGYVWQPVTAASGVILDQED